MNKQSYYFYMEIPMLLIDFEQRLKYLLTTNSDKITTTRRVITFPIIIDTLNLCNVCKQFFAQMKKKACDKLDNAIK